MGSCQVRGCRCHCSLQRVSCSCQISQPSSDMNVIQEQQPRQNRFASPTGQRPKKKSPGNSKDSNETIKQTKSTVTHGKQSSRHSSNSRSPPGDPFNSSQCNLPTETETNWVPIRDRIRRRVLTIRRSSIYFAEKIPSKEEVYLHTFANQNGVKNSDENQSSDPPPSLVPADAPPTSKFITQEEPKSQQFSSDGISHSAQPTSNKPDSLNQQPSIDRMLYQAPSIRPYLVEESNDWMVPAQFVTTPLHQKAGSLNALHNNPDSSKQIIQIQAGILQRFATQNPQVDRQNSLKNSAPTRGVLKQSSSSNRQNQEDNSFRSQVSPTKKQVKFNLPQSYYYKEKIKAQQKFFR